MIFVKSKLSKIRASQGFSCLVHASVEIGQTVGAHLLHKLTIPLATSCNFSCSGLKLLMAV